MQSVVLLSESLQQIRQALQQSKEGSIDAISVITQEVRFTNQENKEFSDLLSEIKQDSLKRMAQFYQIKIHERTKSFQNEVSTFGESNGELQQQTLELHDNLKQGLVELRKKKEDKEEKIVGLVIRSERILWLKRVFNGMRWFGRERQRRRGNKMDAEQRYNMQVVSRFFLPWRSVSYKSGYQTKLVNEASRDIKNIQQHFMDIVKGLKVKIGETEDLIEIKKNAKAEFSYSLSKNLLKTISNLSMEVLALNQVTIRDNQIDNQENSRLLKDINHVVQQKMNCNLFVQDIRARLIGEK